MNASTTMQFHIVNDFGQKYDYLYGVSYARVLYLMIPGELYPCKPLGFTSRLAAVYEPGAVTSLCATQLGELYANFGFLCGLLLPVITVLILMFSEKLKAGIQNRVLLSAVLFLLLMWCARFMFEDNFINCLFVRL
jgi:hypothetical protein